MAGSGKLTVETVNTFIDENYSQLNAGVPVEVLQQAVVGIVRAQNVCPPGE
jgi:hypothetical protein